MKGLGTILNAVLILVGGGAGLLVGKRIRPQMRDTLMTVTGVAVMMMGAGGALAQMLRVENGRLETDGTMMMIVHLMCTVRRYSPKMKGNMWITRKLNRA